MGTLGADIRDAFFDEIYRQAVQDPHLVFMTADMDAFSLKKFKKDLPAQFINVGVAEQNMVAVATGLALSGKKVFIYGIIPFLAYRCLEAIKVNICSMNLPVVVVGAAAGFAFGFEGPTHHAVQDVAVMRTLPGMTILNPGDAPSAAICARLACHITTPVYVRVDRGNFPDLYTHQDDDQVANGVHVLGDGHDVAIVATGIVIHHAVEAARILASQGIQARVIDVCRLKPMPVEQLLAVTAGVRQVVTVEEGSIVGGLGSSMAEIFLDHGSHPPLKRIAVPDVQAFEYGDRDWMFQRFGLDAKTLAATIRTTMR